MDEAWKKARLDELWDAYILKVPGVVAPVGAQDRVLQAVEMLRMLRSLYDEAVSAGDEDKAVHTTARARVVWQLLSLEFGDWLINGAGLSRRLTQAQGWEGHERIALKFILTMHEELGPHPHRPAVDPTPVMMPRWLLQKLGGALGALDEGETHDIVRPVASGRHGNAWSQDRMRAAALEHVAFLHGQGHTKKIAQQRVAARMGVPPATLRDWERDEALRDGYDVAFQAGELKTILDDDPKYAEGDGNSIDSGVLARLVQFRTNPSLADFGQAYRDEFGQRHNP